MKNNYINVRPEHSIQQRAVLEHTQRKQIYQRAVSGHTQGKQIYQKAVFEHTQGNQIQQKAVSEHTQGNQIQKRAVSEHSQGNQIQQRAVSEHTQGNQIQQRAVSEHTQGNQIQQRAVFEHTQGYQIQQRAVSEHTQGNQIYQKAVFEHTQGNQIQQKAVSEHTQGNQIQKRAVSEHSQENQIQRSTNPKIKIIGSTSLYQNQISNFQCSEQQQKCQFKLHDKEPQMLFNQNQKQYNYRNNIQQQQINNIETSNRILNINQTYYQPQGEPIRCIQQPGQVVSKQRAYSEYSQPTQDIQNNKLPNPFDSSLIQQQIANCNSNRCQNQSFQNKKSQKGYYEQPYQTSIQNSQIIQESQINIFDTEIKIRQTNCHYCKQLINGPQYCLNCFHVYDIGCLKELIIRQIENFQQNPKLSCLCSMKIPRIPFIETSFNEQYEKELILKQLQFIFQSYQEKFQNCSRCNFFWVNDQQKNVQRVRYCMCLEKGQK